MRKVKYILLVGLLLTFVISSLIFLHMFFGGAHTLNDVFDENYLQITSEKGTSEFDYFNVQEHDGVKYFQYNGNLVRQKGEDGGKEVQIKKCRSFLIKDDELVYTLWGEEDKVYIESFKDKSRKVLPVKQAEILVDANEYVYIYSHVRNDGSSRKESMLHKYDRTWNEVGEINLSTKGFTGRFEKACMVKGKLLFATEESDLYVYDEREDMLQEIEMPTAKEYSEDRDIIRWNGEVYCMLSYYDDGDMHNTLTKVNLPQSGIYKLDTDRKKAEKVSDENGDIMLLLENQLYVAECHFFLGATYRVRPAAIEYWREEIKAKRDMTAEALSVYEKGEEKNQRICERFAIWAIWSNRR